MTRFLLSGLAMTRFLLSGLAMASTYLNLKKNAKQRAPCYYLVLALLRKRIW